MNNDLLFGGKIVIVAGDGRQILPSVWHGSQSDIFDSVLFTSEFWTDVENVNNQRICVSSTY